MRTAAAVAPNDFTNHPPSSFVSFLSAELRRQYSRMFTKNAVEIDRRFVAQGAMNKGQREVRTLQEYSGLLQAAVRDELVES